MRHVRLLVCLVLVGCDSSGPRDAGTDGGQGPDAARDAGPVCAAIADCDDTTFCNGQERCEPGHPAASANGCVAGTAPCTGDQTCNEASARCDVMECPSDPTMRDLDDDGHESMACAGDDCDDSDANRFPGNPEVCDAAHDEDCDPDTVGSTDADSDDHISVVCCNGAVCGTDCDDGDVNVNPGASETCNGADDDCSGVMDDGGSLCPGGLCVGGRCDFDAWDYTFGTPDTDQANAVAIDGAGNVYMAGIVGEGEIDFGDGPTVVPGSRRALVVVKYGPDGRYEWGYVNATGSSAATGIAVNSTGTRVYVVGDANVDLGTGSRSSPYLLTLDGAGDYVSDVRFGGASTDILNGVALNAEGVLVAGTFWQTVNFGGEDVVLGSRQTAVIVQLDPDGAYVREHVFSASGFSTLQSIAVGSGGVIAVGGGYSGTLPLGGPDLTGGGSFVALLDASAAPLWSHRIAPVGTASTTVAAVAVGPSGRVYGVGHYTGGIVLGVGPTPPTANGGHRNGFMLGLTALGVPEWARSFGGDDGGDVATDVAVDVSGEVSVVGEFTTNSDFGRGTRDPVSRDGFLARYGADGSPIRDIAYSTSPTGVQSVAIGPGASTVICGFFSGTSNFGSGSHVSEGGTDGFVLRVGS